jgi:hypothetical protein
MTKSKWFVPVFAAVLGLIMFGAQAIGGHPGSGVGSLAIMVAFGALILLGGLSDQPPPTRSQRTHQLTRPPTVTRAYRPAAALRA